MNNFKKTDYLNHLSKAAPMNEIYKWNKGMQVYENTIKEVLIIT